MKLSALPKPGLAGSPFARAIRGGAGVSPARAEPAESQFADAISLAPRWMIILALWFLSLGGLAPCAAAFTPPAPFISQTTGFALATNLVVVPEDSTACTITSFLTPASVGLAKGSGSMWKISTAITSFTNNTTGSGFAVLPSIATNGTLKFAPAPLTYGSYNVAVVVRMNSGTNSGVINSFSNSFVILVQPIAHAPVIMCATNWTLYENGSTNGLINVWDYDTVGNSLALTAQWPSNNIAVASVTPADVVSGTNTIFSLQCAGATNHYGTVLIQLTASGVTAAGTARSVTNLWLTVLPVSQPPSFTLATNYLVVAGGPGLRTNAGFATNFNTGPGNLPREKYSFSVVQLNRAATNAHFAAPPSMTTNGTLSFALAAHSYGTNLLAVIMTDNLGVVNGGMDQATNCFTLVVTHAPVIACATNWTVYENGSVSGPVDVWDYDAAGSNLVLTARSLSNRTAVVSITRTNVVNATNTIFTLRFAGVTNAYGLAPIQLLASEVTPVATNFNFTDASSLPAGNHPLSVVAADVNGDGLLDLISANADDNTLTVLTNNGSGGFGLSATLPAGRHPLCVIAADVNGDGHPDLICANAYDNTLTVLTNDGGGGFVSAATIPVGTYPDSLVAADVNGDGGLELINANYHDNTLTLLTNTGGGGFAVSATLPVGAWPCSVVAADVNGDGRPDLINANYYDGTLTILTNNGSGGFGFYATLPVGAWPCSVVAADVNGDGRPDLINANIGDNTLTVLTNDGSGGFVLAATIPTGNAPYSFAAADVNRDGRLDLVSANYWDLNTLSVLTNNGSGAFGSNATLTVGCYPACVIATNLSADGRLNLISADGGSNTLTLWASSRCVQVLTNVMPCATNLTLTVLPVSQPPSFQFATNLLVVAENPGPGVVTRSNFLTHLTPGAGNAPNLGWSFSVLTATNSGSTNAVFSQFPTIKTNGLLSFRTKDYSFGINTVTVVMTDNGVATNGGCIAFTNSFQLQVAQSNYPPVFAGLTNRLFLENATTNLGLPFTLFDPLTTNFTVSCNSADTSVVSVSLTGNGTAWTLWFALATNAFGSNILVTLAANDGILTGSSQLLVNVKWVNQPPSFNLAASSFTVSQYDVPVSLPVINNLQAGPPDESSLNQTVKFIVTNNHSSLFLSPPAVAADGTLSFTPGTQSGTVAVGIKARDNGGTANGGVDTSASQIFTIIIPPNPFPDLAGTFTGLFYDTNSAALASSGFFQLTLANDGTFEGCLLNAGASNAFNGQFSVAPACASVTTGNYSLALTLDASDNWADWTEMISGSVSSATGGWNVALQSYRASDAAAFPTNLAGAYNLALPGFDDPAMGPPGESVFTVAISTNGVASVTGYLADNTFVTQEQPVSLAGYCPVYAPLYGNNGLLIGWLEFTGTTPDSVSTNSMLTWFNAAGATGLYPSGFTLGTVPTAAPYDPTLPNLLNFGAGTVVLSGGSLTTPITNLVTANNNVITVDSSAADGLSLNINPNSGELQGTFISPDNHTNYIESLILQDAGFAPGYFIEANTNWCGSFILRGN